MSPAKVPYLLAFIVSCLGAMADEVRFERIPLTASASGHCLVPVTVDGRDARFIVDSGAGPNSLEPDFAAELNLPKDSEGGSLDGAGGSKVNNIHRVTARDVLIGDKVKPGETPFFVFTVRAKVQLPEDKTFGGILGVQALAKLGAFVDLGSYTLVIPSKSGSKDDIPSNP